jgi:hypothetical protein
MVSPKRSTKELKVVAISPIIRPRKHRNFLSETAGLALGFEKNKNIILADWQPISADQSSQGRGILAYRVP